VIYQRHRHGCPAAQRHDSKQASSAVQPVLERSEIAPACLPYKFRLMSMRLFIMSQLFLYHTSKKKFYSKKNLKCWVDYDLVWEQDSGCLVLFVGTNTL
jgi:hypothetical protein